MSIKYKIEGAAYKAGEILSNIFGTGGVISDIIGYGGKPKGIHEKSALGPYRARMLELHLKKLKAYEISELGPASFRWTRPSFIKNPDGNQPTLSVDDAVEDVTEIVIGPAFATENATAKTYKNEGATKITLSEQPKSPAYNASAAAAHSTPAVSADRNESEQKNIGQRDIGAVVLNKPEELKAEDIVSGPTGLPSDRLLVLAEMFDEVLEAKKESEKKAAATKGSASYTTAVINMDFDTREIRIDPDQGTYAGNDQTDEGQVSEEILDRAEEAQNPKGGKIKL